MKLDRNSYGTVAMVYLFSALLIWVLLRIVGIWWIYVPSILALIWFCCWQTLFHMVPRRERKGSSTRVSAVSDGKVVIMEKVFEAEWLGREVMQISVYMDFWDFHADFWPITGEVTYSKYHPGKHLLAFKPKASDENEHHCAAIRNENGKEVLFKLIAGGFARRIVCYAREGMSVEAGAQCGIIKFGSRVDYFLPLDADIRVRMGEEVRACETIIALI